VNDQQHSNFQKAPSSNGGASSIIWTPTKENIDHLSELLKSGELVAMPTETVYGLAARTFDRKACQKIFEVKGRPLIDPLISHVHDLEGANRLAAVDSIFEKLANAFWPGPLTIVAQKKSSVPEIVTAQLPTVAVRIPQHPIARALLKAVGEPLAAPSANPFGYISPTCAQHVLDSLGNKGINILDGGTCDIGIESTIIKLTNNNPPEILRPGKITCEEM